MTLEAAFSRVAFEPTSYQDIGGNNRPWTDFSFIICKKIDKIILKDLKKIKYVILQRRYLSGTCIAKIRNMCTFILLSNFVLFVGKYSNKVFLLK